MLAAAATATSPMIVEIKFNPTMNEGCCVPDADDASTVILAWCVVVPLVALIVMV